MIKSIVLLAILCILSYKISKIGRSIERGWYMDKWLRSLPPASDETLMYYKRAEAQAGWDGPTWDMEKMRNARAREFTDTLEED